MFAFGNLFKSNYDVFSRSYHEQFLLVKLTQNFSVVTIASWRDLFSLGFISSLWCKGFFISFIDKKQLQFLFEKTLIIYAVLLFDNAYYIVQN